MRVLVLWCCSAVDQALRGLCSDDGEELQTLSRGPSSRAPLAAPWPSVPAHGGRCPGGRPSRASKIPTAAPAGGFEANPVTGASRCGVSESSSTRQTLSSESLLRSSRAFTSAGACGVPLATIAAKFQQV